MATVCVFIKYNNHWDSTLRYVGGEMKEILVPLTATYVGLIELVMSVIGIKDLDKTIVMRYVVEPGMPLVRIQYDADVNFYIQLNKKDVHVLSKFPISIDVLDESVAEAIPLEVGKSNHIDVQPSRDGGQSDEAMQHGAVNNLIIRSPSPPHIHFPTVGLDLHMEDGIEEQHELLNNDLGMDHDDCNAEELNVADAARDSNENGIAASIRAHSIVNTTRTQSVNLCATRMKGSELFVVKMYDDVHICSIEIVQGHHRQVKSWMIGECVKAKYLDPTNTAYRLREIMRDMHDEFGVSFNYLIAWRGKEAALTSLRSDDAESYKEYAASIMYPDADFGICVQHLAANLKTRYKDFKCPMKTYFDGASRAYLVNPIKWSRAYFNGRRYVIMTTNIADSLNSMDQIASLDQLISLSTPLLTMLPRPGLWILEKGPIPAALSAYAPVVHLIGSAKGWDVSEEVRSQIVHPPKTKRGPGRPMIRRILS
ncbi:hypothetical protein TIFTF001_017128 [Ficus carica]|uniref:Uncharacterized protein n=1 Tax=Ficus carica TaxID=3494 RepID=A0AA88AA10_FICCA|nr:hypothetical protein TIFTF001_017128 [Ficus carica]